MAQNPISCTCRPVDTHNSTVGAGAGSQPCIRVVGARRGTCGLQAPRHVLVCASCHPTQAGRSGAPRMETVGIPGLSQAGSDDIPTAHSTPTEAQSVSRPTVFAQWVSKGGHVVFRRQSKDHRIGPGSCLLAQKLHDALAQPTQLASLVTVKLDPMINRSRPPSHCRSLCLATQSCCNSRSAGKYRSYLRVRRPSDRNAQSYADRRWTSNGWNGRALWSFSTP